MYAIRSYYEIQQIQEREKRKADKANKASGNLSAQANSNAQAPKEKKKAFDKFTIEKGDVVKLAGQSLPGESYNFV